MDGSRAAVTAFRLCVDLNIWVKQFLAEAAGRRGTASQQIVQAVVDGRAGVGPLQLIISHTMLSRLHAVMMRKGVDIETATQFTETIANFALLGPAPEFPRVVLGGGVHPTRETVPQGYDPYDPAIVHAPYDPEDGCVLDTALARLADALVTDNFKDFTHYTDDVVRLGRVHVRRTADADLWIVHSIEMALWLRTGDRPTPLPYARLKRARQRRPHVPESAEEPRSDDPRP